MKKLLYILAFGFANTFSLPASAQSVNNVQGNVRPNLDGMDIESMMTAVQVNRVKLLDEQLKRERQNFQGRNTDIAMLNTQIDALILAKGKTTDPKTIAMLDVEINELRTQIAALGSTQQMDILRLQSLHNKRNEAFDIMTNFMKKQADSRQGIIGNMR